ncbi:MAG: tetratricopeptide repeat protein [Aureispira sp.]
MKIYFQLILLVLMTCQLSAQPNCNAFLWSGDTTKYQACKVYEGFRQYYQFDMRGIRILDSCLAICPYFADPYYEYAVVYLKAGNFVGWDQYINAAVHYDPTTYLGLRASCRGKFFADYQGAINDIDSLDALIDYDIGFIHNGDYHLNTYKAICYKALNNNKKAIEIFEKHIAENAEMIGFLDYLHLGVAYQNIGNHTKAIECFNQQKTINNLAENNYYQARSYLELGDIDTFEVYIAKAEKLLLAKQKMNDPYHILEDEIFRRDIIKIKKLATAKK